MTLNDRVQDKMSGFDTWVLDIQHFLSDNIQCPTTILIPEQLQDKKSGKVKSRNSLKKKGPKRTGKADVVKLAVQKKKQNMRTALK